MSAILVAFSFSLLSALSCLELADLFDKALLTHSSYMCHLVSKYSSNNGYFTTITTLVVVEWWHHHHNTTTTITLYHHHHHQIQLCCDLRCGVAN